MKKTNDQLVSNAPVYRSQPELHSPDGDDRRKNDDFESPESNDYWAFPKSCRDFFLVLLVVSKHAPIQVFGNNTDKTILTLCRTVESDENSQ
jgi:hypothetical protein